MNTQEQTVRQTFSRFALQLYHLGYNFISFDSKGVARWSIICENAHDGLRIDFDVKTGRVKILTRAKEKARYTNLGELHKVLLYKAGVDYPKYTKSTETVITLLNITNGLIPLTFKTKSLFSSLTVFDLYPYGKVQNILFQSRGTANLVILDNKQESVTDFVEKVFSQRPIKS